MIDTKPYKPKLQKGYSDRMILSRTKGVLNSMSIRHSKDLEWYFRPLFKDCMNAYEQMAIAVLNNNHKIVGYDVVHIGGMDKVNCDMRKILAYPLLCGQPAFALAHNHPSGRSMYSDADKKLTRAIGLAAGLLNLSLLDHIILTSDSYLSMADHGLMVKNEEIINLKNQLK